MSDYQLSICNKEVCMTRSLGIQPEVPPIIDEFKNPMVSIDLKTAHYEFDYEGKHIVMQPENMIDEKAWRLSMPHLGERERHEDDNTHEAEEEQR